MLINSATLVIRESNVSTSLRSDTIALQGTIGIYQRMCRIESRLNILDVTLQILTPYASILFAIQLESQLTRSEVAFFDDCCALSIIKIEDAFFSKGIGIVAIEVLTIIVATRQHVTNVPEALDLYAAVTTEPTGNDGTLATSFHIARVVAVDNASSRTTVPNNTNQGAAVVALSFYIALVTYVLEGYPA